MDEARKIVNEIKQGDIKPIYFLMGEETFYIDGISNYIAVITIARSISF